MYRRKVVSKMTYTIQSDILRVGISPMGAELSSIYSKQSNKEYLWQGGPAWWAGRAPILFPIVCSLKDDFYTYGGKAYNMKRHGFARHAEFAVASVSDSQAVFEYSDNEETREIYPFAFLLRVTYDLTDNALAVSYNVENRDNAPMHFSIGSHEAYNCPQSHNESFDDYYLEFEKDGTYISETLTDAGLLSGATYEVIKNSRIIPLKHDLFTNDALIFKNIPNQKVKLKSRKSATVIEVDCMGAPHLGIWTKVGAPFICIEPWFGLPDNIGHNGRIEDKPSIITLEAKQSFAWTHIITISNSD